MLNMRSPKHAFRQASELISLHELQYRSIVTRLNLDYYIWPLCIRNDFDLQRKELLTPLPLDPAKSTTHPRATTVVWPLDAWIR